MWRLGLSGGGAGGGGGEGRGGEAYPERPNEPDCIYYSRTGVCGYGSICWFNHPQDRGATVIGGVRGGGDGALPERMGQPVCQHFMRTGTCKYGGSCKYHPRQGSVSVAPVSLSYLGYPLRPGEKECSYHMRTGQCKLNSTIMCLSSTRKVLPDREAEEALNTVTGGLIIVEEEQKRAVAAGDSFIEEQE